MKKNKFYDSEYIQIDEYILNKTSDACPEQYEIYKNNIYNSIGYLRLRHGKFTVEVPSFGEQIILVEYPEGDGCFNLDEQEFFLKKAINSIDEFYKEYKLEKFLLPVCFDSIKKDSYEYIISTVKRRYKEKLYETIVWKLNNQERKIINILISENENNAIIQHNEIFLRL